MYFIVLFHICPMFYMLHSWSNIFFAYLIGLYFVKRNQVCHFVACVTEISICNFYLFIN